MGRNSLSKGKCVVNSDTMNQVDDSKLQMLLSRFDDAVQAMASAPAFAKIGKLDRVFDTGRRVLLQEGGCAAVAARAQIIAAAAGCLARGLRPPDH